MAPRSKPAEICRHCEAPLVPHGDAEPGAAPNASKAGSLHCNGCGCCFGPDGKVRPGHPFCRNTPAEEVAAGYSQPEPEEATTDGATEAPPASEGDPDGTKPTEQPPSND